MAYLIFFNGRAVGLLIAFKNPNMNSFKFYLKFNFKLKFKKA